MCAPLSLDGFTQFGATRLQVLAVVFKDTRGVAALAGPLVRVHKPAHQRFSKRLDA